MTTAPASSCCSRRIILEMGHVASVTQLGIRTMNDEQKRQVERYRNRLRLFEARDLPCELSRLEHIPENADLSPEGLMNPLGRGSGRRVVFADLRVSLGFTSFQCDGRDNPEGEQPERPQGLHEHPGEAEQRDRDQLEQSE